MKKILLTALIATVLVGCKDPELVMPHTIDLGSNPLSTGIKSKYQTNNIINISFNTTPGAKYSVQIYPFGEETPVKTDKFTATDIVTDKIYNLNELERKDYDLIFMDIKGNETKTPILIK